MAIRIRKDGRMLCAELTSEEVGDIYIDDGLHYELSAVRKLIVTTPMEVHEKTEGEWYWKNKVPTEVEIDEYYLFPQTEITRFVLNFRGERKLFGNKEEAINFILNQVRDEYREYSRKYIENKPVKVWWK